MTTTPQGPKPSHPTGSSYPLPGGVHPQTGQATGPFPAATQTGQVQLLSAEELRPELPESQVVLIWIAIGAALIAALAAAVMVFTQPEPPNRSELALEIADQVAAATQGLEQPMPDDTLAEITKLRRRSAEERDQVDALSTDLAQLSDSVESLAQDLDGIDQDSGQINQNAADIEFINRRSSQIEKTIDDLQREVEDLQNATPAP